MKATSDTFSLTLSSTIKAYFQHLKRNTYIITNNKTQTIFLKKFKSGYRSWRESATIYPSGIHLGRQHALLDPDGIHHNDETKDFTDTM